MIRHSLMYIAARTVLLAAIIMGLWMIPVLRDNMVLLVLLAMTLSLVASYFLLRPLRDRIARDVVERETSKREVIEPQLSDEQVEDQTRRGSST